MDRRNSKEWRARGRGTTVVCHKGGFSFSEAGKPGSQRDADTLLVSGPLTSPQPGVRSSPQPVPHMGLERKPKGQQFPCRPQSDFCFRQSRATRTSLPLPPGASGRAEARRVGPGEIGGLEMIGCLRAELCFPRPSPSPGAALSVLPASPFHAAQSG